MLDFIDTVCEEEVLKGNHNMPVNKSVPIHSLDGGFMGLFQVRL